MSDDAAVSMTGSSTMLDAAARLEEPRELQVGREVHINVLLLANRSYAELDEICQRAGITHQQYVVLWTLCLSGSADAGIPIGSVSDGLLNRASDTTRLVDRLVRVGLVERLPNAADRRSVLVRATAEGRRVFERVTPQLQEFHQREWAALDAAEIEMLNALLKRALWGDAAGPPSH